MSVACCVKMLVFSHKFTPKLNEDLIYHSQLLLEMIIFYGVEFYGYLSQKRLIKGFLWLFLWNIKCSGHLNIIQPLSVQKDVRKISKHNPKRYCYTHIKFFRSSPVA